MLPINTMQGSQNYLAPNPCRQYEYVKNTSPWLRFSEKMVIIRGGDKEWSHTRTHNTSARKLALTKMATLKMIRNVCNKGSLVLAIKIMLGPLHDHYL